MSYCVEAYLNYREYLDGRNSIRIVFSSEDEFRRVVLEHEIFDSLYIVCRGEEDTDSSSIELDANGEIKYW